MRRHVLPAAALLVGATAMVAAGAVGALRLDLPYVNDAGLVFVAVRVLLLVALFAVLYGLYLLVIELLHAKVQSKRRRHEIRNVSRLAFGVAALSGTGAIVAGEWVGLLISIGVVGFAITFSLQQPLFSLVGWLYIALAQPYQVGDRVAIDDSKGDVVDIDFFVTTLWEIDGELVASNQPSGRIITLPNSVVLSSHVVNATRDDFPYVWTDLSVQVAYETDLAFAKERMTAVADERIGDEMARRIGTYRNRLADTPVELEVRDRPGVNVVQQESWVELRLRYLVNPRAGQRLKNDLYEAILAEFNEHPERIKFPVGRNR